MEWQSDTSGFDSILRNSGRNHNAWIRAVATEMVGDIKLSYNTSPAGRKYKRGRKYHTASVAGYPPNVDRGTLRASITSRMIGEATAEISSDQEHAVYMEFGTENIAKRPHFRPVILAWQSKIEQHYIRFNVLLRNTGLK